MENLIALKLLQFLQELQKANKPKESPPENLHLLFIKLKPKMKKSLQKHSNIFLTCKTKLWLQGKQLRCGNLGGELLKNFHQSGHYMGIS